MTTTREQTREQIRAELISEIRRAISGAQTESTGDLWNDHEIDHTHDGHDCAWMAVPCWVGEHYRAYNVILSLPELTAPRWYG